MKHAALVSCLGALGICAVAQPERCAVSRNLSSWNARAAAGYLDERMEWWLHWPNAARDHDTACVSCHTALPYALARPALHALLAEREPSPQERAMVAHVEKRVRMWREVEPFYPDQTRGLPKSSESRGTEAVLNALVLAARDASTRHRQRRWTASVCQHVGVAVHSRRSEGRMGVAEFPLRAVGVL